MAFLRLETWENGRNCFCCILGFVGYLVAEVVREREVAGIVFGRVWRSRKREVRHVRRAQDAIEAAGGG